MVLWLVVGWRYIHYWCPAMMLPEDVIAAVMLYCGAPEIVALMFAGKVGRRVSACAAGLHLRHDSPFARLAVGPQKVLALHVEDKMRRDMANSNLWTRMAKFVRAREAASTLYVVAQAGDVAEKEAGVKALATNCFVLQLMDWPFREEGTLLSSLCYQIRQEASQARTAVLRMFYLAGILKFLQRKMDLAKSSNEGYKGALHTCITHFRGWETSSSTVLLDDTCY